MRICLNEIKKEKRTRTRRNRDKMITTNNKMKIINLGNKITKQFTHSHAWHSYERAWSCIFMSAEHQRDGRRGNGRERRRKKRKIDLNYRLLNFIAEIINLK